MYEDLQLFQAFQLHGLTHRISVSVIIVYHPASRLDF